MDVLPDYPEGTTIPRDLLITNMTDSFACGASEHFLGFGERFDSIDQRGKKIELWVNYMVSSSRIKPVPFFMSSKGYGIYINTTFHTWCDVGATDPNIFNLDVSNSVLDYYFIYGPELTQVLSQYTGITGRPPIPPMWTFGPWKSRDFLTENQETVYLDVNSMRNYDIPLTVKVIDAFWAKGLGGPYMYDMNDFTWNPQRYSDPQTMINYVHQMGAKVVLWLTPWLNVGSPMYDYADSHGYFVKNELGQSYVMEYWVGTGSMIDFTNPYAVDWWKDLHKRVTSMGVDGFKCDDGCFLPVDAVMYNGMTGAEAHNLYPVIYDKTEYEIVRDQVPGGGVIWCRSAWAGAQKYPFHWAGDNNGNFDYSTGLPAVIKAGLNIGMSGFPLWGHDIGGYFGGSTSSTSTQPTKELYVRWSQFGALSPVMQPHSVEWDCEPWAFDNETIDIYRTYAKLHTDLIPYVYTMTKEANETGLPIIRALPLIYPDDKNVYSTDPNAPVYFEYLYGDSLLVAPVYQSTTQREIYLPEGKWVDWWDGTVYDGKQTIKYDAPLWKMPLLMKVGAIIPMYPEDVNTVLDGGDPSNVLPGGRLVLRISPSMSSPSSFTMYDGTKLSYSLSGSKLKVSVENSSSELKLQLIIIPTEKINQVSINGKIVQHTIDSHGWICCNSTAAQNCDASTSAIPGFDGTAMIAAVGCVLALLKIRKKKISP